MRRVGREMAPLRPDRRGRRPHFRRLSRNDALEHRQRIRRASGSQQEIDGSGPIRRFPVFRHPVKGKGQQNTPADMLERRG